MKLLFFTLFVFIIGFTGCSSSSTARKPVTNILISPSNNRVVFGNEFTIQVESKIEASKIESIEIYVNNQLVETLQAPSGAVSVNSKNFTTGKHTIRTVATNKQQIKGINYATVSIVSDIEPVQGTFLLLGSLPHNTSYYTQGFEFYEGKLYEGTGNYGSSFIYVYNPEKQQIFQSVKLDDQYFGEGITILNNRLYQITYKEQKGFVYDLKSLEKISEFSFTSKEGWGLTNDGELLIMSNGTSVLTYIDPENFKVVKTLEVSTSKGFVNNLNELEYVNGFIFANIWTTNTIAQIEAQTGRVVAFINLDNILDQIDNQHRIDVFNGIAYHAEQQVFYVTGKWWPKMFKVRFVTN
jgi:glutaminyl-peptide cyclotransferase